MAFEEGQEELACPACGAKHTAQWSRMPVRERVVLKCKGCGGILYEGRSHRAYDGLRLQ